jgi:hypothetical protein
MSNYKAEYWSAGVLECWEITLNRSMFVARRSEDCAPCHVHDSRHYSITPLLQHSFFR